jgi:hypothetical protein
LDLKADHAMGKTGWITLGVVAGVLLLSCGLCAVGGVFFAWPKFLAAGDRVKRLNDLKEVALAVRGCMDPGKRGPDNVDELLPQIVTQEVAARLRKGDIEVVWHAASLNEQVDGATNVLIAWDREPDASGNRLVAFLDGTTATLTPDEFRQKLKARQVEKR